MEASTNFDFRELDIVTDRWVLRKLLGFVDPRLESSMKHSQPEFAFTVEILGKTALMTRRAIKPSRSGNFETNNAMENELGFRAPFNDIYTPFPEEAQESTSHHRIIKYKYGGMSIMIRHGLDASLEDPSAPARAMTEVKIPKTEIGLGIGEHHHSGVARNLDHVVLGNGFVVESEAPPSTNFHAKPREPNARKAWKSRPRLDVMSNGKGVYGSHLTVKVGGLSYPDRAGLELVTRSIKSTFSIEDRLADSWVSQTPNFLTARHQTLGGRKAKFYKLEHVNMKQWLRAWETANSENLGKLATLYKTIIGAVKLINKPCSVSYSGGGSLLIERIEDPSTVPSPPRELRALFRDEDEEESEEEDLQEDSTSLALDIQSVFSDSVFGEESCDGLE